jgi:hypothetical protein
LYGAHARARRSRIDDHLATVNLKEDVVLTPLNDWIGLLFDQENLDRTVAALAASQGGVGGTSDAQEGINARLTKAEVRLRRLQAASRQALIQRR